MASDRIRFLLDEHIPNAIADGLRRRGIDVLRVQDCGLSGAADLTLLQFASDEKRVFVTRDADILVLHSQGVQHSGIVFAPHEITAATFLRKLVLIHGVLTSKEISNSVEFI